MGEYDDAIKQFIAKLNLPSFWERFFSAFAEIIIILLVAILVDFILRIVIRLSTKYIPRSIRFKWFFALLDHKIFNSLGHFIALTFAVSLSSQILSDDQIIAKSTIDTAYYVGGILIFIQFSIRVINIVSSVATSENNHRTIAVRSFAQLTKLLVYIAGGIFILSIFLKQDFKVVLGSLSAVTAVIILVFRDTILGFVSGVQLAAAKMIKVGDWIQVPKYNVDGTVEEINLISAKIRAFDKTLSFVPTYDLISSSVISYESLRELGIRRIKRSIIFKVSSFKFCSEADIERYKKLHLLHAYIDKKIADIQAEDEYKTLREEDLESINARRLTNIGLFRSYTLNYLKNNSYINKEETIMVRQLESTPQGLPLEIYCFVSTSEFLIFEEIQSDIFDHLLTAAQYFNLDIVQVLSN